jgi:hypothetical protein
MKIMRKFHVHFTEKNLTGNAGLVHMGQFAKKLDLHNMLEQARVVARCKGHRSLPWLR